MRSRFTAGLLAATFGAGLLTLGASGAHAGSKGRRNTAIGLGALAAYQLLRGKTTTGVVAGAGAAYAYKRYKDARDDERRYGRYYDRRDSRYRSNSSGDLFDFPAGYNGNDRYQYQDDRYQYQNDRYQYQNGQYQSGKGGSYRSPRGDDDHYYRRTSSRSRYGRSDDHRPPGWSRGRKTGWYRNGRR
jgi:hypothetical protein